MQSIPRITAAGNAISICVILKVSSKKFKFFVHVVLRVVHHFVFEADFFGVVTLVKALWLGVFEVLKVKVSVGEFIREGNVFQSQRNALWLGIQAIFSDLIDVHGVDRSGF